MLISTSVGCLSFGFVLSTDQSAAESFRMYFQNQTWCLRLLSGLSHNHKVDVISAVPAIYSTLLWNNVHVLIFSYASDPLIADVRRHVQFKGLTFCPTHDFPAGYISPPISLAAVVNLLVLKFKKLSASEILKQHLLIFHIFRTVVLPPSGQVEITSYVQEYFGSHLFLGNMFIVCSGSRRCRSGKKVSSASQHPWVSCWLYIITITLNSCRWPWNFLLLAALWILWWNHTFSFWSFVK